MADGIRIRVGDERLHGATLMLRDHARIMSHNNQPKEYRIHLDPQGCALVSETVWQRLQEMHRNNPDGIPEFFLDGLTTRPPTQIAGGRVEAREVFTTDATSGMLVPAGIIMTAIPELKD